MRNLAQTLLITIAAMLASVLAFSAFMYFENHVSPKALFVNIYDGSFGSVFSIANSLERAAPLILAALCTALPARVGLINIGGEGSLVLGGLAATAAGLALTKFWPGASPLTGQVVMALTGMLVGGSMIAFVGCLRHWRGVNETISSLLVAYIALGVFNYLVEGPMKDPASANKPSTYEIDEKLWVGKLLSPEPEPPADAEPALDTAPDTGMNADVDAVPSGGLLQSIANIFRQVHWGFGLGIIFCVLSYLLMYHTTFGFAARMVGGNVRAAQASGLPVGWVIFITCFLAGAATGLAGMVEVATGEHRANIALVADYGFTGILVSFLARHHPLGIIPVAILFGGLNASNGLIQRRLEVSDASIQVFMGTMFIMILAFETFYGRFRIFLPRQLKEAPAP